MQQLIWLEVATFSVWIPLSVKWSWAPYCLFLSKILDLKSTKVIGEKYENEAHLLLDLMSSNIPTKI